MEKLSEGIHEEKYRCILCFLCERLDEKCICWKPDKPQICDCVRCSKCGICLYNDMETTCSLRCICPKDTDWIVSQIEGYCGVRDIAIKIATLAGSPKQKYEKKYFSKHENISPSKSDIFSYLEDDIFECENISDLLEGDIFEGHIFEGDI